MSLKLPKFLNGKVALEDWGLIPYREAFELQKKYVDEISSGERLETLVFCSHPAIVTLGRGTQPGDLAGWTGDTIEVNRGGRATYHGPSQIVFYPLISVAEGVAKKIKPRDLHGFFRELELAVVDALQDIGITSQGHSVQKQVGESNEQEATGVWIGSQKIAAIGIAVRKWIVSHGLALNFDDDPQAFQGILPCGFQPSQVTSVKKIKPTASARDDFKQIILDRVTGRFFLSSSEE
ncbi:MAG: lipoyl(octanoyl) transferase LipB [Bdellovibrionales bacterium]|nr:lipoyl(octanoyl) transferase LipB [Bdellovibrionales bacterium]